MLHITSGSTYLGSASTLGSETSPDQRPCAGWLPAEDGLAGQAVMLQPRPLCRPLPGMTYNNVKYMLSQPFHLVLGYAHLGVQVIMFNLPKGVALVITSSALVDKGFGCVAAECAAAVFKGTLAAAVWLPIFFRPRTLLGSACSAVAVSGALTSFSPI